MSAKKKNPRKLQFTNLTKVILALGAVCLIVVGGWYTYYWNKIYPGVRVAGVDVSHLSVDEATKKLETLSPPNDLVVVNEEDNQKFTLPSESFDVKVDHAQTAKYAYKIGRSGNITKDISDIFISLRGQKNIGLDVRLNEEKLANHLATISGGVSSEPIYPSVSLVKDEIIFNKGKVGYDLDLLKTRLDIGQRLAFNSPDPIKLNKVTVDPTLSVDQEKVYLTRVNQLKDKSLTLTFEFEKFTFSKETLLSFIKPTGGYHDEILAEQLGKVAQTINRDPQEPVFQFSDGKVTEFAPSKEGIKLNPEETKQLILDSLLALETTDTKDITKDIVVNKTKTDIQTAEVNNLGIKELIGRGTSSFRGSIPSRVHNVALATSRVNGHLIKPGEVFSFNQALGDVSKLTGYKEAYVIQNGKTVLGDGGGVCQVSTTMFRAAMNAGLPIDERRAHSYRVGYYEQDAGPGLDATVFAPTTDLKIKNDTSGHILIQAKADTKNYTVTFELYGTGDGRVSEVTKPKILSQTAPPADVYQDDPSLPAGTIKQVEHRAWGAKTVFSYTVKKDGQEIYKKDFYSVYKPWAAVYLRGTGI